MKLHTFPIGTRPHVVSLSGRTVMAYHDAQRGIVRDEWPDGRPADVVSTVIDESGHPLGTALGAVGGSVALMYRVNEHIRGVGPDWRVPTALEFPAIFGDDGRIAVIRFTGSESRIHVGVWPNEPTQDAGICGSSQGLSHFDGDTVIDRDQARIPFDPSYQNVVRVSGAECGVTADDRLVLKIGNVTGTLPGTWPVKDPRLTRQQNGLITVAWWANGQPIRVAADVAATDLIPLTQEPPPPPPPDDDEPPDEEEPPMPELPESLFEDVKAERAKYPAVVQRADAGKILNAVAWKHRAKGWGLSVKKSGNNVPSPQGVPVAYDILHHKPSDTLWGCFTAPAGNDWALIVNWGQEEHHHNPDRPWLAPVQPSDAPPPDDPPGDDEPPPPPDQTEVLKLLIELRAIAQRVEARQADQAMESAQTAARVNFIDSEVRKIRARQDSPLAITLGLPRQLATGGTATGDAKPQHKE